MGDTELSPAELLSDRVNRPDVFHRPAEDGAYRCRLGRPGRSTGCCDGGGRIRSRLCMAGGVSGSASACTGVVVFWGGFSFLGIGATISLALRATVAHGLRQRERQREVAKAGNINGFWRVEKCLFRKKRVENESSLARGIQFGLLRGTTEGLIVRDCRGMWVGVERVFEASQT